MARFTAPAILGQPVDAECSVFDAGAAAHVSIAGAMSRTATMTPGDAADLLRAMLRQIEGPSCVDVRRAYMIDPDVSLGRGTTAYAGGWWTLDVGGGRTFRAPTEAEVLRMAWEARPEWSRPDRYVVCATQEVR